MTQETQRDKALRGEWFIQGDPTLKAERDRAKALCWELNQTSPADEDRRSEILRQLIGSVRGSFTINSPFYCDYGSYITIGDRFFANYNCKILDGGPVVFGDGVRIGPDCTFSTPHHPMDPQKRRDGWQILKGIHVGDNVWFGSGVTVLPGVSIGSDSVIGAGSVVTRDIPSGVFAAGNPCRVIKKIDEYEKELK